MNLLISIYMLMMSSNNSPLRLGYEINDVLHFLAHRDTELDLVDSFLDGEVAVVDQSVGIMDVLNHISRELPSAQSHDVESGIRNRLFAANDEWWNVLARAASSLHHCVSSDTAELMNEHHRADDGKVINDDLTRKFSGVTHDDAASKLTVMSDMGVFHDEVVASHHGFTFGRRATVDGHILTYTVGVANDGERFLSPELEVLRNTTDHRSWKDRVSASHPGAFE